MSKNVRMKKLFSLTLTLGLLLTCTACDKDNGEENTLSTVLLAENETPKPGVMYEGEKGRYVVYLEDEQYYQIGETVHQEMDVQLTEASGDVEHHEYDTTVHSITVTKKLDLSQWDTSKFVPDDLKEIQEDGTLKPQPSYDGTDDTYESSFVIVDLTLANRSGYEKTLYVSNALVYCGQEDGAIAVDYLISHPTYSSIAPEAEKDFYQWPSSGNDSVDVTLMYYVRDEELENASLVVNMGQCGQIDPQWAGSNADERRQYLGAYRIMQEGTVTDE